MRGGGVKIDQAAARLHDRWGREADGGATACQPPQVAA